MLDDACSLPRSILGMFSFAGVLKANLESWRVARTGLLDEKLPRLTMSFLSSLLMFSVRKGYSQELAETAFEGLVVHRPLVVLHQFDERAEHFPQVA